MTRYETLRAQWQRMQQACSDLMAELSVMAIEVSAGLSEERQQQDLYKPEQAQFPWRSFHMGYQMAADIPEERQPQQDIYKHSSVELPPYDQPVLILLSNTPCIAKRVSTDNRGECWRLDGGSVVYHIERWAFIPLPGDVAGAVSEQDEIDSAIERRR